MPTSRVCIDCGKVKPASPCAECRRARPPRKARPTTATRDVVERRRRAAAVRAHRAEHGDWCPGYEREPHRVVQPNILTADHVVPVARGGQQSGRLAVLCRTCNGAKADR